MKRGVLLPLALLLAGCEIETAAFMIEGRNHAITLVREKPFFWSKRYDMTVVVARFPDCQRRHEIKSANIGAGANVTLFRGEEPNLFLIKQGSRWYIASTQNCALQATEEPGKLPEPLGVFKRQGGQFQFIVNKSAESAQPSDEADVEGAS